MFREQYTNKSCTWKKVRFDLVRVYVISTLKIIILIIEEEKKVLMWLGQFFDQVVFNSVKSLLKDSCDGNKEPKMQQSLDSFVWLDDNKFCERVV